MTRHYEIYCEIHSEVIEAGSLREAVEIFEAHNPGLPVIFAEDVVMRDACIKEEKLMKGFEEGINKAEDIIITMN